MSDLHLPYWVLVRDYGYGVSLALCLLSVPADVGLARLQGSRGRRLVLALHSYGPSRAGCHYQRKTPLHHWLLVNPQPTTGAGQPGSQKFDGSLSGLPGGGCSNTSRWSWCFRGNDLSGKKGCGYIPCMVHRHMCMCKMCCRQRCIHAGQCIGSHRIYRNSPGLSDPATKAPFMCYAHATCLRSVCTVLTDGARLLCRLLLSMHVHEQQNARGLEAMVEDVPVSTRH